MSKVEIYWMSVVVLTTVGVFGGIAWNALYAGRRRDSMRPGLYVCNSQSGNPWAENLDFIYIHEVKNGWVRYTIGKYPNLTGYTDFRSSSVEYILDLYTPYKEN